MPYTLAFALLTGLFAPSEVAAQRSHNRCELILESVDNTPITAEINGRRFDRTGTTLHFGNMPAGRKDIVIYRVRPHRGDGGASARPLWEGRLTTRRGVQTVGAVDASRGRVRFQNYVLGDRDYRSSDKNSRQGSRSVQDDSQYRDSKESREEAAPTATEARWNELEKVVKGKTTDTDKLKTLRASIGGERISVANLGRSMGWLSFESSRLEWAKGKMGDVADPENLQSLSSMFTFAANQKSFEEALAKLK